MTDNVTTPIPAPTVLATKDIGGVQYPSNVLADLAGADVLGLVTASPAANSLLGRLKAIADAVTAQSGYVDGLEALATTLNGYVDGLEGLQGTANTTLTAIAGYVDGLEALLGAATPAGENVIGAVGSPADLIDITLSVDTSAYATGDVLADTQVIANGVRVNGGRAVLQSVIVIDEDDQGQALDLMFFGANQSLGTENATTTITDTAARDFQGIVSIASTDFIDLGGVRVATIKNIGLLLEAASGVRDLYVGAISRGTGTYTASGLKLRLGLLWS